MRILCGTIFASVLAALAVHGNPVFGGWGRCNLVKLAKDFKSLVAFEDGAMWRDLTPKGYVEGSVL